MKKRGRETRQVDSNSKGVTGNSPPVETRWKRGCASPNPKGRPRTGVISKAVKAILSEVDPQIQQTGAERLAEIAYRRAKQGSYKHLEFLAAYAEGRPAQTVDLNMNTRPPDEEIAELIALVDQVSDEQPNRPN